MGKNTTPLSILHHHHHHHKPRCQLSNCTSTSTHTHTHIPKHTQVIYFLVSIISSAIYFRKLPQLDSTQLNSTLLFSLSLTLLLLPSSLLYLITSLSRSSFCFPFLFLLSCFLAFFCLSLSVPPLLCVWGHFSSLFPSFFLEKVCYSSFLFFLLKKRDTEKL